MHSCHQQIFTDAEEQAIAGHISADWLPLGCRFTEAAFVEIATAIFLEKDKDVEPLCISSAPPVLFLTSNTEFFAFRRVHVKCRPSMREDHKISWLITLFQFRYLFELW
jgi:hypothetical protein